MKVAGLGYERRCRVRVCLPFPFRLYYDDEATALPHLLYNCPLDDGYDGGWRVQ